MNARLAALATVATLALPAASAHAQAIQPGARIHSSTGQCTLNWMYDGPGGIHAGTAAHCVSGVGQQVDISYDSGVRERIGEVSFRGDQDVAGRDYAFIRIDAEDVTKVSNALKGHPAIPTGVSTSPAFGDLIQFSGYGIGVATTNVTRERRQGVLGAITDREQNVFGFVINGDSGGPVANLSDGNTALGIVATVGAGLDGSVFPFARAGEGGPLLSWVLADAASHGFPVSLRTV